MVIENQPASPDDPDDPVEDPIDPLVLVTGASGFIASHVIYQLQTAGHKVRGTVRSLHDETKIKAIHNLCPDAMFSIELVEADLLQPDTWDRAVKGCTYVLHIASPFPATPPSHDDELIKPAVEGTLSVLRACLTHHVKRVVLTSSVAAVFGDLSSESPPGKVFTEDDWTDECLASMAYVKSKTMAEKAAWNFLSQLPAGSQRFELVVINPSLVMGPAMSPSYATSFNIVEQLMIHEWSLVPRFNFPIADVRDVALAHVTAMTSPEAAGNRYIINSGNMWVPEMALILDNEFKTQGYNIATWTYPYFLMWLASLIDKGAGGKLSLYSKIHILDNTQMKTKLGITPRDLNQTIIDMAYSLIELGFIKRTNKYRGQPDSAFP